MKLVRAKQIALDGNLLAHVIEQEQYEAALALLTEIIQRAIAMRDELVNEGVVLE